MKKTYNKLVRDGIIDIIKNDGKVCSSRILTDEEYLNCLNDKLQEELNEYLYSGDITEIADIEEVIRAILIVKKVTLEDFEKIREDKATKNGTFTKKLFLEWVEENE